MAIDPRMSGEQYCEVYDEPRHRFHLRNTYTNIYEIELARGDTTFFHRHCEDTVYFVVADAEIEQSFQDKPAMIMTAHAGGTLCRAHKNEPLIHQVKNIGAGTMHMVGAEALARPPVTASAPMTCEGHELAWTSNRFRVYDVHAEGSIAVVYGVFGLLVALDESDVQITQAESNAAAHAGLSAGGYLWVEPPQCVRLPKNFRGIFAEWI